MEKTIYSEGGIVVSTSRVSLLGDQYFVNQIASTKVRFSDEVDRIKDVLLKLAITGSIILGLGMGSAGHSGGLGVFVSVAGVIASIVFIKPKYKLYHVYLGMSSGEVDAYRTTSMEIAQRIANAINEALASRA